MANRAMFIQRERPKFPPKRYANGSIVKNNRNMSARVFCPLPTVENLLDKMNSLLTYYNAHKSKHQASKASGTGTDKVYHVKWDLFPVLHFLADSTIQGELYRHWIMIMIMMRMYHLRRQLKGDVEYDRILRVRTIHLWNKQLQR